MAILSKQIGWSNESNLLWEILKKLNRLAGIITGLKSKYRVFSALVTQGRDGGSSPDFQSIVGNPLTIGKTYRISNVGEGNDWTVVGAPNNNINTYFIATGENAIWGVDGELEYDATDTTPVVTILENTIGNVWFTYSGIGVYMLNSNNLFPLDKTMIIGNTTSYDPETNTLLSSYYGNNDENSIMLKSTNLGQQINLDGELYNTPLEIRVYN